MYSRLTLIGSLDVDKPFSSLGNYADSLMEDLVYSSELG